MSNHGWFKKDKDSKGKIAVILIDMQKSFVDRLRRGEAKRIIPKQLTVLERCNKLGIPVIVLELRKSEFGETVEVLIKKAKKNSNFYLIAKSYDDGFIETELHSHLRSLKIKKLFLMGINADYCVRETGKGAIDKGYKIITSEEVIAGQTDHSNDNSIPWFSSNGSCIGSVKKFAEVIQ